MWWAVFITIVTGPHHYKRFVAPQTFASYGECQQFIDKATEETLPKKKSTIMIACGDALSGGIMGESP